MNDVERIVSRILIRASIEEVWREITKTDSPQGAFFNMRMHTDGLRAGGQVRMRSANGKYTGVVGEILEFDPPHRFAHTFKFTQYDDPPCKVIYELKEVADGVEFTLISEDVPRGTKTAKEMHRGGDMIVKTLKAIVETGHAPYGTRMLHVLFKLMEPFSPKSTRTEHWPLDRSVL
jgi:uncharacterized protein YndB with AHSA1/START domain